jgi:peroxiredoxin family protein/TusA-related sulfurtransferase
MGHLEDALNIPLDQLRKRIAEIDKEKPVLVYCQVGLRGHIATRILLQNGFKTRNLSGGYKTYRAYLANSGSENILHIPINSSKSQPNNETRMIIDACGLQCPGPIMKLKKAIDEVVEDDVIEIRATEMGFAADIPAWCTSTGNTLLSMRSENGTYIACVKKGNSKQVTKIPSDFNAKKTMVIFSNDFDKMMAAFIIANGAASTGSEVTMFFTFWGLNLLRKENNVKVEKNIIEKMFGFMMPRGAKKLVLSKMHMGGMGTMMIRKIMKNKNVFSLSELMDAAQKNNVRFVACSMSMDIMGIKKEELIEGVEIGGVASYLEKADSAGYNLFI